MLPLGVARALARPASPHLGAAVARELRSDAAACRLLSRTATRQLHVGAARAQLTAAALPARGGRLLRASPARQLATLVSSASPAQATLAAAAEAGLARGERDVVSLFSSSFLGGVFLCFSGALYLSTLGNTPELRATQPGLWALLGGTLFPTGLTMIVFTQTDLLTSNFYYQYVCALAQQPARVGAVALAGLRACAVSAAGNAAASVGLAAASSALLFPPGSPPAELAARVTERKARQGALVSFGKGVGANFLVCTAVFMALSSHTPGGKIAALWGPITVFAALGLDHSVANMYTLPLGLLSGADVSVDEVVFGNLLPVIAGNAVGAVVLARLQLPPAAARALADRLAGVVARAP